MSRANPSDLGGSGDDWTREAYVSAVRLQTRRSRPRCKDRAVWDRRRTARTRRRLLAKPRGRSYQAMVRRSGMDLVEAARLRDEGGGEMTTPLDAWVMRRLLADLPLNGEIDLLSGVHKAMASYLANIPLQGRQAAWDAMLASRAIVTRSSRHWPPSIPWDRRQRPSSADRHTWETWQRPMESAVSSGRTGSSEHTSRCSRRIPRSARLALPWSWPTGSGRARNGQTVRNRPSPRGPPRSGSVATAIKRNCGISRTSMACPMKPFVSMPCLKSRGAVGTWTTRTT